ncbi:retron St85 family RNA-directed DNA polymerase [Paraclostridium bifermentans]|uniref:retron St85 family RNA-directed DNA polymerase n=1 Tax=Paraclostridium bifermentans TaxID=1490 RepID=UPI0034E0116A
MHLKYNNLMILESLNLPKIYNLESFSTEIGLSTTILYLLSQRQDKFYHQVIIPKRKSGNRILSIPSMSMKIVQKWIKLRILDKIPVSNCAMAFRRGNSYGIKTNAELHKYNTYILRLDLKDFFNSIKREKVFYLFREIGYNNYISNILSNICTFNESLPQGGITSPSISNLICKKLDIRLESLASKRDITYTRYADDLIFSCNDEVLLIKTKNAILDILKSEGMEVNKLKTKFIRPGSRKKITGLHIDKNRVIVPRDTKRKVRAMIHYSIATGDYSKLDEIKGYISFISSIEENYISKIKSYINKIANNEQYRLFDDIVESYNNNKILKDLDKMDNIDKYTGIFDENEYDLSNDCLYDRIDFLEKHGLQDIIQNITVNDECNLDDIAITRLDDEYANL